MEKIIFVAAFTVIALASAFASVNRATFFYVQTVPGVWELISTPDVARCLTPTVEACSYTSPVNIGTPANRAQLIAASATPSPINRLYILP